MVRVSPSCHRRRGRVVAFSKLPSVLVHLSVFNAAFHWNVVLSVWSLSVVFLVDAVVQVV